MGHSGVSRWRMDGVRRTRVRSWRRRSALLLLLSLGTLPVRASDGPAVAPFFSFFPVNVAPGGSITVTGTRWSPASGLAIVVLTDVNGARTILGTAPIAAGGTFTKRFTIPVSAPGPYHINAQDAVGQMAINLYGPLQVLPDTRPWFGFRPWVAAPGATLTLVAGGFRPGTTGAIYGVISRAGQVTILGAAAVSGDTFTQTLTVPSSLPDGGYYPFVRDSQRLSAFNATGVLTVASDSPPPAVAVGRYPIGAAVNPATGRVYVPNGGDNTVSVIDEATSLVVATIPVGGLPCAVALNAGTNRVYIANVNTRTVSVIDGATNSVVATIPTGPAPCAVAALPLLNRVFVGNYGGNSVTVIDGATDGVIATLPVASPPYAVGANAVTNEVFVALGHTHGLAIIDGTVLDTQATIPVGLAPDAIGVDETTNRIYVGNYLSHSLSVIDGQTRTVVRTIPVGVQPSGVAVDPGLALAYVSNWASDTVTVVDTASMTVVADIPAGDTPDGGAVNPVTHRAYMVNSASNDVTVIDGPSVQLTRDVVRRR